MEPTAALWYPAACGLCGNTKAPLRFDLQTGAWIGACPCTNRDVPSSGPYPVAADAKAPGA